MCRKESKVFLGKWKCSQVFRSFKVRNVLTERLQNEGNKALHVLYANGGVGSRHKGKSERRKTQGKRQEPTEE